MQAGSSFWQQNPLPKNVEVTLNQQGLVPPDLCFLHLVGESSGLSLFLKSGIEGLYLGKNIYTHWVKVFKCRKLGYMFIYRQSTARLRTTLHHDSNSEYPGFDLHMSWTENSVRYLWLRKIKGNAQDSLCSWRKSQGIISRTTTLQ